GWTGRQNHLLHPTRLNPLEQSVEGKLVRAHIVERGQPATEDVVTAPVIARALKDRQIARRLDHANGSGVASRVSADRTDDGIGSIEALPTRPHLLRDRPQCLS